MTETNNFEIIETNNTEIIEIIETNNWNDWRKNKKKTGPKGPHKIKRKPERWLDDGRYTNKPLDPDSFNKYWIENLKKTTKCLLCNTILMCSDKMDRHEKTKKCQKIKARLLEFSGN